MVCLAVDMKEQAWKGTSSAGGVGVKEAGREAAAAAAAAENGAATTAAVLGDCLFILQRTVLEVSLSWARIRLNWRTAAMQRARKAAS
jgi:hypothetical protein